MSVMSDGSGPSIAEGLNGPLTGAQDSDGAPGECEARAQALLAAGERYRSLIEKAPIPILVHSDLKIVFANQAAAEILGGQSPDCLLGRDILSLIHPEFRDEVQAELADLHDKIGQSSTRDLKCLGLDGRVLDIEVTAVRVESNLQPASQCYFHDITARKQTENALRNSEAYLRTIMENVQAGVLVIDSETHRIVDANSVAARIFGAGREHLIGRICHDSICPAGADCCPKVGRGPLIDRSECIFSTFDKQEVPVIKTVVGVDLFDRLHLVETFLDISELKRAEQSLRQQERLLTALFNATRDSIILLDPEGRILAINQEGAQRRGKTPEDCLGDMVCQDFTPAVAKKRRARIEEAARTGQPSFFEERRGQRHYLVSLYPVLDDQGQVLQLASYCKDITEGKEVDDRLKESERRIRALFNATSDSVILQDPAGRILAINEEGAARRQRTPEECLGRLVYDTFPSEVAESRRTRIQETVASGRPCFFEERRGESLYWISLYPIFDRQDRVVQLASYARDITRTRQADIKLREQENYLKTILDSVQTGIFIVESQSRQIVDVNPAGARMFGDTKENILGRKCQQFICPADICPVLDQNKQVDNAERMLLTAAGETKPVLKTVIPVTLRGAEHLLESIVDISLLKRTEDSLRESEARIRALFNATTDSAILLDLDDRILAINEYGARRRGKSIAECLGELVYASFDPEAARSRKAWLEEAGRSGQSVMFEEKRGDNSYLIRLFPILDPEGRVVQLASFSKDVTSQKTAEEALLRSEQKYRGIFENAVVGIYQITADGLLLSANPTLASILGYVSVEELMAQAQSRDEATGRLHDALKPLASLAPEPLETLMTRRDGQRIWVSIRNQEVADPLGAISYIEGFVENISKRKQAEEDLRLLNIELEDRVNKRTSQLKQANEELNRTLENLRKTQTQLALSEKLAALGELVAGVAHEINTPVGVALSASSTLGDKTLHTREAFQQGQMKRSHLTEYLDSTKEGVEMILVNLNRAAELIRSFKMVAADQVSEGRRAFQVNEYIAEILLSLRPKLKKTNIQVAVDCPPDLKVDSYPGALSHILTNFIVNSLVHGFDEGQTGRIDLEIRKTDGSLLLSYSDNGKGIPPENINRIFEPFFTTARHKRATGLGLHIVYNIVTQTLGGTITCQSEPGQGATFNVTIPL
jgi:PAS domain S-box-containing protein